VQFARREPLTADLRLLTSDVFSCVGTKGRLSPAAEKFWQCAKEAASKK